VRPIDQPGSFELHGPDGSDIAPLPVVQGRATDADGQPTDQSVLVSRWRMTLWERLRALRSGDVWLTVRGTTHPPVGLATTSPFDRSPPTLGRLVRGWLRRRGVWLWGQNLNEHRTGRVKGSMLRHGRASVRFNAESRRTQKVGVEWLLGKLGWGFSVELGRYDDDEVQLVWKVPGVALYWSLDGWLPRRLRDRLLPERQREVRLDAHDGALWWGLWVDPMEWDSRTPKWRQGSLHPVDVLLGSPRYKRAVLRRETAQLALPEWTYHATVELVEDTWSRPRWPWPRRLLRAEVTPATPVPVPGKGENSWDCDDDAVYGMTVVAGTVSEAVGAFVASVLRDRERHGGPNWAPPAATAREA
jgi:hypothetical protein